MSDLGQSTEDIELKIAQMELLIEEKGFAKKKIAVAQMELDKKRRDYEQSLKDIDEQVKTHKEDLASLNEALTN